MNKFLPFLFIAIIVLFLTISVFLPANAGGLVPCGGPDEALCTLCDFFKLGQNIINFLLEDVALPLTTVMIAVGGVTLAISGGSPKRLELGKKILTSAVIGLIVVLASWLIINTIINLLAGGEQPTGFPWPWNEIQC